MMSQPHIPQELETVLADIQERQQTGKVELEISRGQIQAITRRLVDVVKVDKPKHLT